LWQNIAYGKPQATRKEIVRAAELANAMEFIEKLPDGFDTIVGDSRTKSSATNPTVTIFWEACCHAQEGRKGKARELLTVFLRLPALSKKQ
jgi:hypothetical protein